ncbi:uncharacterized protein [Emydura macquarii macquarii]|uniref:uncharacterized protein isoform X2 n=1 Tax=Emydura macquarii macquarii TaxID=1129001 RepID=UPI00352A71AC
MSTKMSPMLLMMGREALFADQVQENYMLPEVMEPTEEDVQRYRKDFLSQKEADAALCLKNISKAQERQQRQYSKRHISKFGKTTFEVGQSVLLLNARRKTRQGGSLEPTYRGPYKLTSVVGKRVTLETMSGKRLGTMYSIGHLKAFKGPAQVVSENISEDNVKIQTAVDDIPKNSPPQNLVLNSGDECDSSGDCFKRSIDVLKMEEEECVLKALESEEASDGDDPCMEVEEDREWFQKVRLLQTDRDGSRVEARVGNISLYGISFYGLKPGQWLADEVIDAYLFCVVKKASQKVGWCT